MLGGRVDAPAVVVVVDGEDVVGQLHGGAAGLVQLVDVVSFCSWTLTFVYSLQS